MTLSLWRHAVSIWDQKIPNKARPGFGSTYTKIGTFQRRLAWPLGYGDKQINEAFHIFLCQLCETFFK